MARPCGSVARRHRRVVSRSDELSTNALGVGEGDQQGGGAGLMTGRGLIEDAADGSHGCRSSLCTNARNSASVALHQAMISEAASVALIASAGCSGCVLRTIWGG